MNINLQFLGSNIDNQKSSVMYFISKARAQAVRLFDTAKEHMQMNEKIGTTIDTKSLSNRIEKASPSRFFPCVLSGFIGSKSLQNITRPHRDKCHFMNELNMQRGIYNSVQSMPHNKNTPEINKQPPKTYAEVCALPSLPSPLIKDWVESKMPAESSVKSDEVDSPKSVHCLENSCDNINESTSVDENKKSGCEDHESSRLRSESECSSSSSIMFISDESSPNNIENHLCNSSRTTNPFLASILGDAYENSDCDSESTFTDDDYDDDCWSDDNEILDYFAPVGGLVIIKNIIVPTTEKLTSKAPCCSSSPLYFQSASHVQNIVTPDINCDITDSNDISVAVNEANNRWNSFYGSQEIYCKKSSHSKSICFPNSPDELISQVFEVPADEDRKGIWEIYATNNFRFKRRIKNLEDTLNPILTQSHRSKIFKSRFDN